MCIGQAAASMPSFELWLLLHFEDIQAALHRHEVMRHIKLHIPGCDKGAGNAFAITGDHLAVPTQRAEWLAARFAARTDPAPFTAIVELVKLLTMLRG